MTLAHGTGAAAYDELIVAGVLLVVLVLSVLHVRWTARRRRPGSASPPTDAVPRV